MSEEPNEQDEQQDADGAHRATATIRNRQGLHFRPAGKIMLLAQTFESAIEIEYEGQRIDAKTGAVSLVTLAVPQGGELGIAASGPDAAEAVKALVDLIDDHFGMTESD